MGRPKLAQSFCERHQEFRAQTHCGKRWSCRSCVAIHKAAHASRHDLYSRRREYHITYAREWQKRNPEKHKASKRAFHHRHKEEQSRIHAAYYLRNKEAIDNRMKRLRTEHPDRIAEQNRRTRYGAHHTEWRAAQLVLQDGRCAFCLRSEKDLRKRLHTDHDHQFDLKDARGWRRLLCQDCNLFYGLAGEQYEVLLKASEAAKLDAQRPKPNREAA